MKFELNATAVLAVAGLAVVGVVAWKLSTVKIPTAGEVGQAAADAAAGTVLGAGDVVGLPRTDAAAGQKAVEEGDWLKASLYLPAPDFLHELGGALGRGAYDLFHPGEDPTRTATSGGATGSW